jgi:hypothetical protein
MGGMMNKRQRWWLAGVAGVLAAVTLLVVPALGQVGDETGVLHLQMDAINGDRFLFVPTDGGEPMEQILTASNCKLHNLANDVATNASLVEVVGSVLVPPGSPPPYAGLKDHRLGVGQPGEGVGEPCGKINRDRSQVLILSLAEELQDQSIGYAEINLGFKFDGDAILETSLAGDPVDTITVDCIEASDCGPDSGGSDNKLVILSFASADPEVPSITGVFDTIVIRPGDASPNGAISLEGDTLFNLVGGFDGEIGCFDEEPTVLGGGNATFTVTRGVDTNGLCKGINDKLLYNFDSGAEGDKLFVDFVTEPVVEDGVAQFLEVIRWEFASPPAVPSDRTLIYDDHLIPDVENPQEMPWCKKDPRDASGDLPSGAVVPTNYLPGTHTSCLIEANSRVTPSGAFVTEHIVYNIGDGKRSY